MKRLLNPMFHLRLIGFMLYYFKEVVFSNIRVARDIISYKPGIKAGIVAVPITELTHTGVTVLANLLSMTPGTLSLEYDAETSNLYIHSMYLEDEAAFISHIKAHYEQRIARIMKG